MVNGSYQIGLLVLLFGGFLYAGGTGAGLFVMLLGLLFGGVGVLQDGIPERNADAPRVDGS